jgi:hypothetical protein
MKYKTTLIVLVSLYVIWIIGTAVPVMFPLGKDYNEEQPEYHYYSFTVLKIGFFTIPLFFLCTPIRRYFIPMFLFLCFTAYLLILWIFSHSFHPRII